MTNLCSPPKSFRKKDLRNPGRNAADKNASTSLYVVTFLSTTRTDKNGP